MFMRRAHRADKKAIEKKFSDTAFSLVQERNDFFLPQILDYVRRKKWVNLRPEYQRRLVWDNKKRSLFIESLLLNVPIPPVFLFEWDLNRYEVMDGQQRLNSIVDFYENRFLLTKLEKWRELEGLRYKELPKTLQRGLDRRRLSATLVLAESAGQTTPEQSRIRKLVFERLNTGGQHLNAQELRNCLYEGPFNDLLTALSRDPVFTKIWEIPPYKKNVDKYGNVTEVLRNNPLYQRMQDCQIVLRFFAFRNSANIKGSVRSMLDRTMDAHLKSTPNELADLKRAFHTRLNLARDLFGEDRVFRYEKSNGKLELSKPLYDGVMVALDRLWADRARLLATKSRVVRSVDDLLKKPSAFKVIVGRPNTAKAVQKRMALLQKAIRG
jgi:hypothetical protein